MKHIATSFKSADDKPIVIEATKPKLTFDDLVDKDCIQEIENIAIKRKKVKQSPVKKKPKLPSDWPDEGADDDDELLRGLEESFTTKKNTEDSESEWADEDEFLHHVSLIEESSLLGAKLDTSDQQEVSDLSSKGRPGSSNCSP